MFERSQAPRSAKIDLSSLNLLRALETSEHCPVCQLVSEACEGMLWILLWESVNDSGVRAGIRRALGFCPRHTLRLCQIANAECLGMTGPAIIFADVLTAIRMRLRTRHSRLVPDDACPICTHEQEMAQVGLHPLLQDVHHPFLGPLIQRRGLCLPHYGLARTLTARGDAQALLQTYQEARLAHRASLLNTAESRALAVASATMLRGEASWPPARSSEHISFRRGTAQQAAFVLKILRADLACPICIGLVQRNRTQYQAWLHALLADSPERTAFIAAGGVCRGHAEVLDGLAIEAVRALYTETWTAARATLATAPKRRRSWLGRGQSPQMNRSPCPLCAEAEHAAEVMAAEQACSAAAASMPYCLRHLRLVLTAMPPDRAPTYRARQDCRLRTLAHELDEMVRKSDWQYRDEPRGSEQHAWARAAAFFVGSWLLLDPS
jgi:hypothetical protein